MRRDGRPADAVRPVRMTPGFIGQAEGSVLIEMGRTRVVCTASIEEKLPPFKRGSGSGWITAEYGMLPRATATRSVREIARGRPAGRTQEIQRLVGRALRSVVDLPVLGERTIWVDCDVLEADGGTRTASITGGFVAMALALHTLRQRGLCAREPLLDSVAAVSVGLVDGQPLLDLCYEEDVRASVDLNLALTGRGRYVEVQGGAEGPPFEGQTFDALLELGRNGLRELTRLQMLVLAEIWPGLCRG